MSDRALRVLLGISLLISGWMTSFLMTVYVLPRDVFLSMVGYAASMAGLLITIYELASIAVGRSGKRH